MAAIRTNVPVSWPTAREPVSVDLTLTTNGVGTGETEAFEVGRFTNVVLYFNDDNVTDANFELSVEGSATADGTYGVIKLAGALGATRSHELTMVLRDSSDINIGAPFILVCDATAADATGGGLQRLNFGGVQFMKFSITAGGLSATSSITVVLSM